MQQTRQSTDMKLIGHSDTEILNSFTKSNYIYKLTACCYHKENYHSSNQLVAKIDLQTDKQVLHSSSEKKEKRTKLTVGLISTHQAVRTKVLALTVDEIPKRNNVLNFRFQNSVLFTNHFSIGNIVTRLQEQQIKKPITILHTFIHIVINTRPFQIQSRWQYFVSWAVIHDV